MNMLSYYAGNAEDMKTFKEYFTEAEEDNYCENEGDEVCSCLM